MISEKDKHDCSNALIDWFKTQGCDPADGSLVMLNTIASQLVAKTTDVDELQRAIKNTCIVLTLDVAAILRSKGITG